MEHDQVVFHGMHTSHALRAQNSKLYYTLCIILYLLQTVKTNFRKHFKELLAKYPNVNVGYMGFPSDWEAHPLWTDPK